MVARESVDGRPAIALASEFLPADRAAWESLVGDVAALRSVTYDGLAIEPLYSGDGGREPTGLPGFAPYIRGRTATSTRKSGWDIRQIVDRPGDRLAVTELERGATSLLVDLRAAEQIDEDVLEEILEGVLLDVAPIVLDAGRRWAVAGEVFFKVAARRGIDTGAVRGSFGADPFGAWASDRDHVDLAEQLHDLARAAARADVYPQMHLVTIDGRRFHDAGASDAQELGFATACAVATIRALTGSEPPLDARAALPLIELRFAATADQFATIAKFRAARRLWSRVAEIAGAPAAASETPLHAVSSSAMMTRYDPAVNVLRGTVACFAAGVAGADAITVLPHDHIASPGSSELGRRLARNTQAILAMESHLAEVIDPAGGSWYVERLTGELAQAAWEEFQRVEQAGGFQAAVELAIVNERIAAVRERRREDVATRRAPITGVTEFPQTDESRAEAPSQPKPIVEESGQSLVRQRWADEIESLRQLVDARAATTGARPSVFLATIGAPASFARRATFAQNYFAVAGIDSRFGPVSDDPAAIATAFGAGVACICFGDATSAEQAAAVATALARAGATRVYLADPPRDVSSLTAAGVTHTIQPGDDLRLALGDLVDHLVGSATSPTAHRESVRQHPLHADEHGDGRPSAALASEVS